MEMTRCMMIQSKLPMLFWAEAVANFIRNRCITKMLKDKTPYELWHGERPNMKYMRTFGETAYMLDKAPGKGKLDPRGIKCIFFGYDESSRCYRVWVPSKQRVTTTRDIKFIDTDVNVSPKKSTPLYSSQDQKLDHNPEESTILTFSEHHTDGNLDEKPGNESQSDDALTRENTEQQDDLTETPKSGSGRPRRIHTGKRDRPRKLYQPSQEIINSHGRSTQEDSDHEESDALEGPKTNLVSLSSEVPYKQAINGPDKEEWMSAIIKDSLIRNDTWQIVNRPKDHNIIGCWMVLRNKYDSNGQVERRKARLVARGFTQRPGIDFHDTFALVARLGSMRLLLALAVKCDLKVHQMDITTAYLHGTIEEEAWKYPRCLQNA